MSVNCQQIIDAMEKLAPRSLAEGWDNVGLLLGNPIQKVSNILVTLDATPEVALRAEQGRIDMIIAHHPLIFKPLTSIRTDQQPGVTLTRLLKNDIALYVAHTNLDSAVGGVNDALVAILGLEATAPLTIVQGEKLLKLAVFVPESHIEQVRQAITEAGAGHIGNYSHCTFQTAGTGTFLPLSGTNPFLGQQGKLEYAPEFRLETVMSESIGAKVISAMLKAHPYEEAAYDLYTLNNAPARGGLGRVGHLTSPLKLADFASAVKAGLGAGYVRVVGNPEKSVHKVAVCGGSGGSLIREAARCGADVYVTGDVKYHEAQEAIELGLSIIDAGHFITERPVIDVVTGHLQNHAVQNGWQINIAADNISKDIFMAI